MSRIKAGVPISPNVPTFCPLYVEPNASQVSSINRKFSFLQILQIISKLKGLPKVCANMIAFVFLVIAVSVSTDIISFRSISINTGIAPNCIEGLTVVGKPAATEMISSPFFITVLLTLD